MKSLSIGLLVPTFSAVVGVLSACATSPTELYEKEPETKASPVVRLKQDLPAQQAVVVKKQVKYSLKDPESARFRNLFLSVPQKEGMNPSTCGEVNARNSYGGYTGFRWFFMLKDEPLIWDDSDDSGSSNFLIETICLSALQKD